MVQCIEIKWKCCAKGAWVCQCEEWGGIASRLLPSQSSSNSSSPGTSSTNLETARILMPIEALPPVAECLSLIHEIVTVLVEEPAKSTPELREYQATYATATSNRASQKENTLFDPLIRLGTRSIPLKDQKFDSNSLVVSIASDCRNNRSTDAQASYGIYWGPESKVNDKDQLWEFESQSNENAILIAASKALRSILMPMWYAEESDSEESTPRNAVNGLEICKILILTDSMYLVNEISEHIWKWKKNGFKNGKKKPVVKGGAFQELDGLIEDLEARGIPVWFWLIKKEFNHDADALAEHALDEKPKSDLCVTNPITGEVTTGRNWIKDPITSKTIPGPDTSLLNQSSQPGVSGIF
ncbi:hypothetical protein G7Y89_g5937 [Cudoniella acicularis]|uniref:RNase H type-1 domain-containing protein n=1 Tax=Cudoniella acicularis TaxID=354080 RepID=A0A8H4W592_9HELO|nr:hypothetical protein G7Y89_g5937 [Cudoniella acicularis]